MDRAVHVLKPIYQTGTNLHDVPIMMRLIQPTVFHVESVFCIYENNLFQSAFDVERFAL